MNKYSHVRTMRNLDDEILKLKLKKDIIEQDMVIYGQELKRSLSPARLISDSLGFSNRHFESGKFYSGLKAVVLTFSAFRGGLGMYKKVMRIFKKKK